jgi:RNA polymerase sigma factor for flagellar operon FliA
MQMGRPPTRQEVANWLGVDRSEYDRIERDSQQTTLTSIHASPRDAEGGETGEIGVLCDDAQADPAAVAQRSDLRELVTKGFSRAERLIIILYYYESMTMKEIGLTLALSESRVSQMHASVLRRLRAKLQHRADELALDDAPPIAGRIP